jgi:cytochrome P450
MTTDETTDALPFPFPSTPTGAPPPEYAILRETAPVRRVMLPRSGLAWLVTRYDDTVRVFLDPSLKRCPVEEVGPGTSALREGAWMIQIDSSDHTRARRVLQPFFAHRRIKEWRARINEISDGILRGWIKAGPPGDVVGDYAFPVAVQVTCELMGLSKINHDTFRRWGDNLLSTTHSHRQELRSIMAEVTDFFRDELDHARATPGDGLLNVLVRARDADVIDDGEMVNLAYSMFLGGFSSSSNLVSRGVLLLLRHPDQHALLREEPHRVPAAVQEILRYSVVHGAGLDKITIATKDVQISGVTIAAGDLVVCPLSAANHDPAKFAEPDRFDITRANASAHLAFGRGRHMCVGAALGLIQLECMLDRLIHTLPDMSLAQDEANLPWSAGLLPSKLEKLLITWS